MQSLQLIWGGKELRVRATGTLDALRRLRGRGLVTDREGREVADAYVLFRRLEHHIQWATGLQTHSLPADSSDLARLARSLGYATELDLNADIERAREPVSSRLASLLPRGSARAIKPVSRWSDVIHWLDEANSEALDQSIMRVFGNTATVELCRDIRQLARRPDDLLGSMTRERFPELCSGFLDALIDAADPEQAARYVRTWLSRLGAPGVYVRPMGEDVRALRRLIAAFGASAFIGNAIANRPELGESVVWTRRLPTPEIARNEVDDEVAEVNLFAEAGEDPDNFVGALRRAKARMTVEVALADLAGEISTREATLTLSALADATLEHATRFALGAAAQVRGLALLAVGKLGGNEIGYGSDLDVLFVFDPREAPTGTDPHAYFAQRAQRVIRLLSTAHPEGPGYELDTRLRPSGSHGLLVTSIESFARYHDISLPGGTPEEAIPSAQHSGAAWERQSLVRARFAAGDAALGKVALWVAHTAAYERGAPAKAELHRVRMRMERELGREKPGRHDLKVGRGGLSDIEFAVQYLQMENGKDLRVRTTETPLAINILAELGLLRPELGRDVPRRVPISHGGSSSVFASSTARRRACSTRGPRGSCRSRAAWECATPPAPRPSKSWWPASVMPPKQYEAPISK